jgi:serine/threonine protein kinase
VLHPALIVNPQTGARFIREAQAAAHLEHPHIVPIYDIGEAEGRIFLAMRYMAGGSLKDRLDQTSQLPYHEALDILCQAVEGLSYAHQNEIIHRNLKPGNILFDEEGRVRVSDFGFAKLLIETDENTLTISGEILGALPYMAPELCKAAQTPTPAMDVYALAWVFLDMLIDNVPYDSGCIESANRVYAKGPQLAHVQWPLLGLDSVIEKALAPDPADRFESVLDFKHALLSLMETPAATPPQAKNQESSSQSRPMLCGKSGLEFPLGEMTSIGRRTNKVFVDLDLTSLDQHQVVSRQHAQITRLYPHFVLKDLGSHNGTFVNGRKIRQRESMVIHDGDEICFGSLAKGVHLVFKA